MPTTYSRLHVFIGFVILAIVMNALAPNFLSAAGTALNSKTLWVQLCSAGASKFVPMVMSGPSDAPDNPMQSHASHCALCVASLDPVTPSLPMPALQLIHAGMTYLPSLFEHGVKTLFAWATGQALAPPVGA